MRFYFHFNKPASQSAGRPRVSVHIDGVCHIVDNVICNVKTIGRINRRQPLFVMTGRTTEYSIKGGVLTLGRQRKAQKGRKG